MRRGHGASLPQLLNWLGVCDDSIRMGHITTASKQVTAKNRRGAAKDRKGQHQGTPRKASIGAEGDQSPDSPAYNHGVRGKSPKAPTAPGPWLWGCTLPPRQCMSQSSRQQKPRQRPKAKVAQTKKKPNNGAPPSRGMGLHPS